MDIIIKDKDRGKRQFLNPATGEQYDDEVAVDRTGMILESRPKNAKEMAKDPRYDIKKMARSPKILDCINCGGNQFQIIVDSHPRGYGAAQFVCLKARCGFISPVFQLKVPDMIDFRARQMGLIVTDPDTII